MGKHSPGTMKVVALGPVTSEVSMGIMGREGGPFKKGGGGGGKEGGNKV